jgi:glycosyltransferase involved in cell wall biosynthesis
LKIAIIHEWLLTYAGSERVLEVMLKLYPTADVFCLVDFMAARDRGWLKNTNITTSFLQKFPGVKGYYRGLLSLMPLAVEQFDIKGYDVIISNSHAAAKGVLTGPDQLHICYCYSPMRYAWDLQNQYLFESKLSHGLRGVVLRIVFHSARIWDVRTASNVDHFLACSNYIGRRIRKAYGRSATTIYPGVDSDAFTPGGAKSDYYLTSSRAVPYKKMNLIVQAFSAMPDRKLIVIGDGPQLKGMKALAGPNVTLLGYQPFEVLREHMRAAKAFIFAAEEDFGIAPLEAQACGTPVLAYSRGGASETVIDGATGLHFSEQTAEAICDVVNRFEAGQHLFDKIRIRAHASRFSNERFMQEFKSFVDARYSEHCVMLEDAKTPFQVTHSDNSVLKLRG